MNQEKRDFFENVVFFLILLFCAAISFVGLIAIAEKILSYLLS